MKKNSFLLLPNSLLTLAELNPTDKLILSEVYSLAENTGYCYASNEYLSKVIGISEKTVTNSICRLKMNGYIKTKSLKNNNRRIYIVHNQLMKKGVIFPEAETVSLDHTKKHRNITLKGKSNASYDIEELMKIK